MGRLPLEPALCTRSEWLLIGSVDDRSGEVGKTIRWSDSLPATRCRFGPPACAAACGAAACGASCCAAAAADARLRRRPEESVQTLRDVAPAAGPARVEARRALREAGRGEEGGAAERTVGAPSSRRRRDRPPQQLPHPLWDRQPDQPQLRCPCRRLHLCRGPVPRQRVADGVLLCRDA